MYKRQVLLGAQVGEGVPVQVSRDLDGVEHGQSLCPQARHFVLQGLGLGALVTQPLDDVGPADDDATAPPTRG